jgi:hypothetical protein
VIEEMENLWWEQWRKQVFPSLIPYKKWKVEHRNPRIGDIVLVHYPSKVSKGEYRLARITDVHPDQHGVTRTVTVGMRPRDAREKVSTKPPHLPSKPLVTPELAIQRIIVILPVEEQEDFSQTTSLNPEASTFVPSQERLHGFNDSEIAEAQRKRTLLANDVVQEPFFGFSDSEMKDGKNKQRKVSEHLNKNYPCHK